MQLTLTHMGQPATTRTNKTRATKHRTSRSMTETDQPNRSSHRIPRSSPARLRRNPTTNIRAEYQIDGRWSVPNHTQLRMKARIPSSKSEPGRPRSRARNDAPSCREARSVVSGHERTVVGAQTKPDNTDRKETKRKRGRFHSHERRKGGEGAPGRVGGWVEQLARVRAAAPCARPNPSPPVRSV